MIERETNTTVINDRSGGSGNGDGSGDSGSPLVALLVLAVVIIAAILLYNYYGRDTVTEDNTDQGTSTEINVDTNDADTSTAAPTTSTTATPTTATTATPTP